MRRAVLRAFIAFELPLALQAEVQAASQRLQRRLAGAPLRWVAADSIHFTLKFLGQIKEDQVAAIGERLRAAAAGAAPFSVALTQLGAFPTPRKPRVLWAGLQVPAALDAFQQALEAALEPLGFAREPRPFTPHLTLGRAQPEAEPGRLAGVAAALAAERLEPLSAELRQLTLFRSQLNRRGAVYNPLIHIQLSEK